MLVLKYVEANPNYKVDAFSARHDIKFYATVFK